MATNGFLQFAAESTNIIDDETYQSSSARINGVVSGLAVSSLHNKMYLQWSTVAWMIGQFIADSGYNTSDSNPQDLLTNFKDSIKSGTANVYEFDTQTGAQIIADANASKPLYAKLNNVIYPLVYCDGTRYAYFVRLNQLPADTLPANQYLVLNVIVCSYYQNSTTWSVEAFNMPTNDFATNLFSRMYITSGKAAGTTIGTFATAEGLSVESSGDQSHAEGCETIASNEYTHAEGYGSEASGSTAHAEGSETTSSGYASHSEGNTSAASGSSSHAEGYYTTASGDYGSHSEGNHTTAAGGASHAEGYYTQTGNDYAHAEGNNTRATGSTSHAEGYFTFASGSYSHSEGYETYASGASSHAEGQSTNATNTASFAHVEGKGTTASAICAHAEGYNTTVSGKYSHSEGNGTIANGEAQHAGGKFNIVDTTSVEIIGNGSSDVNRSNARTLDWNGNEILAGKLTLGLAPTDNMDAATKQYVDNAISSAIQSAMSASY